MENKNDRYQKHLTLQDRYDIEEGLNHAYSLTRVAEMVSKDKTTISKEIRKRRVGDNLRLGNYNDCKNRYQCPIQHLCEECDRTKNCSACKKVDCRSICNEYHSEACRYTRRAPYVCNGCSMIYDCRRPHFYYRANVAHTTYVEQLKNSREGIALSRQQLYELDCLITPLIRQGQSIAHIYATHKAEIPCSMKTIYNYIDQGIFTVRNIDLPKKVKYKARKKKRQEPEVDYAYRKGRTYQDFQTYISEHLDVNVVELDTVHGSNKKGNVILTMLFRNSNLMIIFLMKECTQECVKQVFNMMTQSLGIEEFQKCFPIILTDNGSEFKDPERLEKAETGEQRTKVFFCDPLASWQKGKLEKNHEYIRKVLPKGKSLDEYTQEEMTTLANHINSTARASLNGRTPYELAQILNSPKLLEILQLQAVEPDKVVLKPQLLERKK